MCQRFIPILNHKGQIVNVSSVASHLRNYNSEIVKRQFRNPNLILADLEEIMQQYEASAWLNDL